MASTYINIHSTASNQASYARRAIDDLQRVVNEFKDTKAVLDSIAFGSDWVKLGEFFDLSPTDAEAFYNLWGSVNTELQGTFIAQLLSRCGNG